MTEQGPEPTGWELLRAINRIEKELAQIGEKVVSHAAYESDQRGNDERHSRTENRVKDLESTVAEADKLKRQQHLTIALAITSPLVAFVLTFLRAWIPT